MSRARFDWFQIFDDLRVGLGKGKLAVFELSIGTPAAAGSPDSGRAAPAELQVTGESPDTVQIQELEKALNAARTIARCKVVKQVEVTGKVVHDREHKPHRLFTLSGTLAPVGHEEN